MTRRCRIISDAKSLVDSKIEVEEERSTVAIGRVSSLPLKAEPRAMVYRNFCGEPTT